MASRRRGGGGGSHRRNKATISAMSTCNLPQDIIVNILSRLPVKSLSRFRCVCKPWLVLFSNPRFVSMHIDRSIFNTSNNFLVVQTLQDASSDTTISLLQIENPNFTSDLVHPFPDASYDVVGSIDGLVCLSNPPLSSTITLWNPATKLYKNLPRPTIQLRDTSIASISLGFGFDFGGNDYKVQRIVQVKRGGQKSSSRVEVYSVNSDSWREIIKADVPAVEFQTKCQAIVKGVPYWVVTAGEGWEVNTHIVSFDLVNEVFQQEIMPDFPGHDGTRARIVDFKGSLALLVYSSGHSYELNKYIDVWMMDDCGNGKGHWIRESIVGPIFKMKGLVKVKRLVGCTKNGEIVVEDVKGELILYDPQNKNTKNVPIHGARACSVEVFNYMESLVSVKGAKQIGKEVKKDAANGRKTRF